MFASFVLMEGKDRANSSPKEERRELSIFTNILVSNRYIGRLEA